MIEYLTETERANVLFEEPAPRVSLPNKPDEEPAPEEETQEPPPSGWRSRPGLF